MPPDSQQVWVFGYGSLIYHADFPYVDSRRASIVGWRRRFWQGSHDHRGTPEAPGRVVTLEESPGELCQGRAYLIDHGVFQHLDHREKNGYERYPLPITLADYGVRDGVVYIAPEGNFAWLGEKTAAEVAAQIAQSTGPSGKNRDYVLNLAAALQEMEIEDAHVFELALLLKTL
ncbi:MAG: cation transport protein ChaC [Halieaceae bacterium]|jgi:cation transport protein ChaC